ncbi:MAG TPA: type VI secretion system tube protein TssD [Symbiobacteriaceae bacterium]|jgi:type VI secretion system secreted protein Hcp
MRWAKWAAMALVVVLGIGLFAFIAQAGTPQVAVIQPTATPKGVVLPAGISMVVDSQKQGRIKGSASDGSIAAMKYSHQIVSPRDPASGLPTGQRMHKPLVITKLLDRSSPQMMEVLVNNENLTKVEIRFVNAAGLYYTVKLTNANIASVDQKTYPDGTQVEEIGFTYERIEWTWADGGVTSGDDWEARTN